MFSHWMTSSATAAASNSAAAPPPDVLIEVGPPPFARYAAHSALLAAHSGYLRSALRTPTAAQLNDGADVATVAPPSPIIYVPNITADQFGPLLTYMYTGYLDLNSDNIFAVLLATHVLHMPRAADICRTYLTRSSSTSVGHAPPPPVAAFGSMPALETTTSLQQPFGTRIVRPIASKAPLGGVAFAAPMMSARMLLPSKDTPFKVLLQQFRAGQQTMAATGTNEEHTATTLLPECSSTSGSSTVVVQPESKKRRRSASSTPPSANAKTAAASCTVVDSTNRCQTDSVWTKSAARQSPLCVQIGEVLDDPVRFNDVLKLTQASGPGNKKTIVDIASCDGPVRFRRVLNEAYGLGRATSTDDSTGGSSGTSLGQRLPVERNAQLVATSFHLQMAKTISGEMRLRHQQQQQQQRKSAAQAALPCSESESENSQQEINVSSEATNPEPPTPSPTPVATRAQTTTNTEELYVCVYCKHTFKSQYCFQKHAKRHINPLTIDDSELLLKSVQQLAADESDDADAGAESSGGRKPTGTATTTVVRREVRPLDMNVQYYPCKTCGSKFPSYYFVHKHRKLCHANEEN